MAFKVLLVEDHPIAARLSEVMLSRFDCATTIAPDGHTAAKLFQRSRYDFVLMDIGLPDMDGFTTSETLHQYETDAGQEHTPIYVLTAHTSKDFEAQATRLQLDGYFHKPLTADAMRTILAQIMEKKTETE
jgi:CheY-like chemotaxis protein